MHGEGLGAWIPIRNGHGRSRAHYRECEVHRELLAFLELLLQSGQRVDVAERSLLDIGVDLLDSLLGALGLGGGGTLLDLLVGTQVAEEDAAGGATELDHLEREGLAGDGLLAVFLDELAVEREALGVTVQGDVGTLVGGGGDGTLNGGADRELGLDLIPRVRGELLVAEAELVVLLVEVEDLDLDGIAGSDNL